MSVPTWYSSSWFSSWLLSWGRSWGTHSSDGGILLHSPSEILRQAMIDLGVLTSGTDDAYWPVYATAEPNDPDECVTIYDTTGREDGRTMPDGVAHLHYGVQIRIRARDHTTGYQKGQVLRRTLQNLYDRQVSIDDNLYCVECVTNIPDLINVGQDVPNSKRRVLTLNPLMVVTRLS